MRSSTMPSNRAVAADLSSRFCAARYVVIGNASVVFSTSSIRSVGGRKPDFSASYNAGACVFLNTPIPGTPTAGYRLNRLAILTPKFIYISLFAPYKATIFHAEHQNEKLTP